jgi:hypothetical protein
MEVQVGTARAVAGSCDVMENPTLAEVNAAEAGALGEATYLMEIKAQGDGVGNATPNTETAATPEVASSAPSATPPPNGLDASNYKAGYSAGVELAKEDLAAIRPLRDFGDLGFRVAGLCDIDTTAGKLDPITSHRYVTTLEGFSTGYEATFIEGINQDAGSRPEASKLDGTVVPVANYVKTHFKDLRSIQWNRWTKPVIVVSNKQYCWSVEVTFSGRDAHE